MVNNKYSSITCTESMVKIRNALALGNSTVLQEGGHSSLSVSAELCKREDKFKDRLANVTLHSWRA